MDLLLTQFPPKEFSLLAVVLGLPLLGAFVNGVFGKRMGKEAVRLMALSAVGGSFVASVLTFLAVVSSGAEGHAGRVTWKVWTWFTFETALREVPFEVAFSADALTATMMLVVTGIGWLIHLYSTAYMAKDPGFHRFFAYLNLFLFSMLVLILGDNLAVLFVGWEGVGLCSYLLIGFWYTDEAKAAAGKKAFIANRIGDFGLLVAMAMLLFHAGSLSWSELENASPAMLQLKTVWPIGDLQRSALPQFFVDWITPAEPLRVHVGTLICLCLFLGCAGKSAQIPLYVWLPDAMAGPTPVSALIHAATMVTAGVYLVARTSFLFAMSPAAMAVVAATGALTALLAASIAFAQNDLKKVLAYSTVSQLGFMFIGVGVGAFSAGIFHVLTHAFFKGCLFLCAGSVIHAMHERIHDGDASQDMRNMGGLRKYMPVTHATFLVSCLAIAGFPLFSGFWSKDEILWKAFSTQIGARTATQWVAPPWFGQAIYAIGLVAAVCTAFYMFRAYFLTFWGDFRGWKIVRGFKAKKGHHHHEGETLEGGEPHESPLPMTVPLVVLATGAAIAGPLYMEPLHIAPLEHFLAPIFARATQVAVMSRGVDGLLWPMLGVGFGAFVVGAGAAYYVYVHAAGKPAASFVRSVPWLHRIVQDKWRVDELYEHTAIGMIDAMGDTAAQFDKYVVDGLIARLTAAVVQLAGSLLRALQTGRVQVYAAAMMVGAAGIGWFLFQPHAHATIDPERLMQNELRITAAPGLGYTYRWHAEGDATPGAHAPDGTYEAALKPCIPKTVHLSVKTLFGGEEEASFTACNRAYIVPPGGGPSVCCTDRWSERFDEDGQQKFRTINMPGGVPHPGSAGTPRTPGGAAHHPDDGHGHPHPGGAE